ncbi:MAG: TonB-dependent receptor plug domain-containing protein [Bacteroidetes bacterium]|nr:MAG: TonB-dependent receptor plug domain-containing protein [Bacteroidota bacterium]
MKKGIAKAVASLLFLFIAHYVSGQRVKLQPVDDLTKADITAYKIQGIKGTTLYKLKDTLSREDFAAYDSIMVSAYGYYDEWLKGVTIPNIQIPVLVMKVKLLSKPVEVEEVVVSASKFVEKKKDVAQSIVILQQRDIAFAGQPNTADLLQDNGNVLVQRSQLGGGSPIMRGFEANKVLIVVDGVRMNNAIYRGGHLQNVLRIDNNILERVEIVQGPGSVVYGSDALGGVMHFMTSEPIYRSSTDTVSARLHAGAMARYASAANQLSGNFNFNLGWDKVAWFSSFSYSQYGALRQGSVGLSGDREAWKNSYFYQRINDRDTMLANHNPLVQTASGYEQLDVIQKLKFKTGDVSHLVNFQYSTTGNVPRYDRMSLTDSAGNAKVAANRFLNENPTTNRYTNAEWFYGPEERIMLAYTAKLSRNVVTKPKPYETMKVYREYGRITASWQSVKESRHNRGWQKPTRTDRYEKVQVISVNADFQESIGKNELRYGAEVNYNDVTSTAKTVNIITGTEGKATTRYPGGGSNMLYSALYATLNREMGKHWVLNAGLRGNFITLNADFSDTVFTKLPFPSAAQRNGSVNGQLGIVYNGNYGWRFAALVATGFRAPNVDDMGKVFDSDPKQKLLIVPNEDLKPEYTYNAELKASKQFGKRTIIEATGWYTLYSGAIVTLPYQLNGSDSISYDGTMSRVYAAQNANKAYLYGGALVARWAFAKDFELNGAVNYTYGRIKTDSTGYPLDHIAPVFGRAGVKWLHNKINLEFFTLFNGAKKLADYNLVGEDNYYDATPEGMPAWYTLNLRGAYAVNQFTTFQLGIENLLDQNYRVFASGISAPGINVTATLRVQL